LRDDYDISSSYDRCKASDNYFRPRPHGNR